MTEMSQKNALQKPSWLRRHFNYSLAQHEIKRSLREKSLHTVCESARCPNLPECFGKKTATFMIMGDVCTRNCGFCAVSTGVPGPLDLCEPRNIAEMVTDLGLKHVVVTSVTRDDLPDGGASHFAKTIREIRCRQLTTGNHQQSIEVLTPDFNGDTGALDSVLAASPDVFNHNLETVERLSKRIRNRADYDRSLSVLKYAANARRHCNDIVIKSGLMVGLGETDREVFETIRDLRDIGCRVVTIGQYLRPSREHLPVERYVEPEVFKRYKEFGQELGIDYVFAGPLVRSSYMAGEVFENLTEA